MQRAARLGLLLWLTIVVALGSATLPHASRAQADCGSIDPARCLERQFRDTEQRLAEAYKQKLASLDERGQQALRTVEVAWIKQRDATCGSASKQTTMEGWVREMLADQERARCLIRLSEQRARELAAADTDAGIQRQASVPATQTSDLKIAVTVSGMEDDAVGAPITVTWRITENVPPKPQMRTFNEVVDYETGSKKFPPPPIYKAVLEDASLIDSGKRWLDDQRLDFVIVSVPNSVRLKGDGFLVIPPYMEMPFKVKFDSDRLRVVFPLYLPEPRAEGSLTIRPLASGNFPLTVTRVSSTSQGQIRTIERIFSSAKHVIDRKSTIIIQDLYSAKEPVGLFTSPNDLYDLLVYQEYFEVFDHRSGHLISRKAGYRPTFSPTGRFLTYSSQRFFVVDLLSQENVYVGDVDDASFSPYDQYVFLKGGIASGRYGHFELMSPYTDRRSDDIFKEEIAKRPHILDVNFMDGNNRFSTLSAHGTRIVIPSYVSIDNDASIMVFGNGNCADFECRQLQGSKPSADSLSVASLVDPFMAIRLSSKLSSSLYNTYFERRNVTSRIWTHGTPMYKEIQNQDERRDSGMQVAWELISKEPADRKTLQHSGPGNALVYKHDIFDEHRWSFGSMHNSATPSSISSVTGVNFSPARSPSERRTFWFDDGWDAETLRGRFPGLVPKTISCDSDRSDSGYVSDPKEKAEFRQTINRLAQVTKISFAEVADAHFQDLHWKDDEKETIKKGLSQFPYAACDLRRQHGKFTYILWKDAGDGLGTVAVSVKEVSASATMPIVSSRRCVLYKKTTDSGKSVFCSGGQNEWEKDELLLSREHPAAEGNEAPPILGDEENVKRVYVKTDKNVVLSSGAETGFIDIYDLNKPGTYDYIEAGGDLDYGAQLATSSDGSLVIQINVDGTFAIYRRSDGARVLSGVSVDNEYIIYSEDGYYDASPDGAHFVYRYFPGMQRHYEFAQFDSTYHRPDIIRAIARGETVPRPSAPVLAPPVVSFKLDPDGGKPGKFTVRGNVTSTADLKSLRVFVDGAPVDEVSLAGRQAQIERSVQVPDGKHFVTLAAYNAQGFSSVPSSVNVPAVTGGRSKGQLFYVGVAVDLYRNTPEKNLKYAKSDMQLILDTLKRGASGQYRGFEPTPVTDSNASEKAILAAVEQAVDRAGIDDTIIISFAGHGELGQDEKYYFMSGDANWSDIAGSALAWEKVSAVLSRSHARILVLLDACHSGLASNETLVPNDAYAAELMRDRKAGMAVLAASKGRQLSHERGDLSGGHGLFSYAVSQALGADRRRADTSGDGVVDLQELYRYLKAWVVRDIDATNQSRKDGQKLPPQTPWMPRNEFIGAVPIL